MDPGKFGGMPRGSRRVLKDVSWIPAMFEGRLADPRGFWGDVSWIPASFQGRLVDPGSVRGMSCGSSRVWKLKIEASAL